MSGSQKWQDLSKAFKDAKITKTKKIAIWMHATPDPDAIGSALGLAWLIKKETGAIADIFHEGVISHPENRSLMNVLNLSFKGGLTEYENNDKDPYAMTFCVDTTERNLGIGEKQVHADGVIDHHREKLYESEYSFAYNRQVGACATLIYDLIDASPHNLAIDDEVQATALLFGIITDTQNLLSDNLTDSDIRAFMYFRERANSQKIAEIKSYPIPSYFFDYEATASDEDNKVEVNGALISFIGSINEQRRDVIAYLSERLLRKEGIDTTVIVAVVGTELQASIRSRKVSLDVNEFAKKVFGMEYAGGKRGIGGAKVPMGYFSIGEDSKFHDDIIELAKNYTLSKIKNEITKDG